MFSPSDGCARNGTRKKICCEFTIWWWSYTWCINISSNGKTKVDAKLQSQVSDSDERKEVPHHICCGTGVLVAISPAKPNYRDCELMSDLHSNTGSIDYVPMFAADGIDEEDHQQNPKKEKNKLCW